MGQFFRVPWLEAVGEPDIQVLEPLRIGMCATITNITITIIVITNIITIITTAFFIIIIISITMTTIIIIIITSITIGCIQVDFLLYGCSEWQTFSMRAAWEPLP